MTGIPEVAEIQRSPAKAVGCFEAGLTAVHASKEGTQTPKPSIGMCPAPLSADTPAGEVNFSI
jgi:hypothetical protein